jgi:hypothetical protein
MEDLEEVVRKSHSKPEEVVRKARHLLKRASAAT